jgi:hypothetical protein
VGRTLRAGHELFRDHLMPLDPNVIVPDRATLAAWPAVSRVSADGLYPAAPARGGSKGPSEGPFLSSRVSTDELCSAALAAGDLKDPLRVLSQ